MMLGDMNNVKLYPHEIVFTGVGIIVSFLVRMMIPFELSAVFVINLLIYWIFLTFFVLGGCFVGYFTLIKFIEPKMLEKMPMDRYLSPRNFYLLTSTVVTTLIVEKIYGVIKSPEVTVFSVFVFLLPTYLLTYKISRFYGFPRY
jgi:hypothetical protein